MRHLRLPEGTQVLAFPGAMGHETPEAAHLYFGLMAKWFAELGAASFDPVIYSGDTLEEQVQTASVYVTELELNPVAPLLLIPYSQGGHIMRLMMDMFERQGFFRIPDNVSCLACAIFPRTGMPLKALVSGTRAVPWPYLDALQRYYLYSDQKARVTCRATSEVEAFFFNHPHEENLDRLVAKLQTQLHGEPIRAVMQLGMPGRTLVVPAIPQGIRTVAVFPTADVVCHNVRFPDEDHIHRVTIESGHGFLMLEDALGHVLEHAIPLLYPELHALACSAS